MMDSDALQSVINAIHNNRTDIVRSLVEICKAGNYHGDDGVEMVTPDVLLNGLSCECGTLLHFATKLGNVDVVRTLLSAGADPSVKNNDGESAYDLVPTKRMAAVYVDELLRCAANLEPAECIGRLIASGVPVDSQDFASSGNTALHWASSFGSEDKVQCLLEHGAQVNVCNSDGATPLHDAVARKDVNIIKLLLESGANPLLKSFRGKYKEKCSLDLVENDLEIKNLLLTFVNSSAENTTILNENNSISSSSESLRIEGSLVEEVRQLSVGPVDSPVKHNMSSYITQTSNLPPFPQLTAPPSLITDTKLHLLWPLPQQIIQIDEPCFKLMDKYSIGIVHDTDKFPVSEIINVWKIHSENFASINVECLIEDVIPFSVQPNGKIVCHVNDKLLNKPESYKIIITSEQLKLIASDIAGLHYGLNTICQLFHLYQGEDNIPAIFIEDWPVLRHRAVLLDLTPGARKPALETLKGFIKIISTLKLNEIHFYFRFGTKSETKWPYCNCDIIEITNFCNRYCVRPVLAIDVMPETSLEVVGDISVHTQSLMYLVSSKTVHIGPNLSKLLLEDAVRTKSPLKLSKVLNLPCDCMVYLCSNGYSSDPRLLHSLPFNVILIEFGYQENYDYDSSVKSIITSGLSAFIGIGTSSWGSIAGCPESAINNIYKATQTASFKSALGLVIADWKTTAHHPALCFSWPGILVAAGLSWNNSIHLDFLHTRLPELLNHHVLRDSEQLLGYLIVELGRLEAFVHRAVQAPKTGLSPKCPLTSSVLHLFLIDPDNVPLDNLSADLLQQAVHHLKKFKFDLQKAKPECFQKGEVVAELQLAVNLMLFSCGLAKVMILNGAKPFPDVCGVAVVNIGISNLPPIAKTDLANKLLPLVELFCGVWLSRNLPCGLHASLYLFNALLHKLIPNDSEHFFASADGFVRQ